MQIVDVGFQHSVNVVHRLVATLAQHPDSEELQTQVCRAVRDAKLRFMDRGLDNGFFDVARGATELLALTRRAIDVLEKAKGSNVLAGIKRHARELAETLA